MQARAIAAFLLFEFLCLQAHELIHHVTARAVCGAWGTMTFSIFLLAPVCERNPLAIWATFAGPALTYGLIVLGGVLARREATRRLGIILFFANLPLARFVTVLTGGDEGVMMRRWELPFALIVTVCVALLAMPAIHAYRAMRVRRKPLAFAMMLMLPLLFDFVSKRMLLARILERASEPAFFGISWFILAFDAAVLVVFLALRPWRLLADRSAAQSSRTPESVRAETPRPLAQGTAG